MKHVILRSVSLIKRDKKKKSPIRHPMKHLLSWIFTTSLFYNLVNCFSNCNMQYPSKCQIHTKWGLLDCDNLINTILDQFKMCEIKKNGWTQSESVKIDRCDHTMNCQWFFKCHWYAVLNRTTSRNEPNRMILTEINQILFESLEALCKYMYNIQWTNKYNNIDE